MHKNSRYYLFLPAITLSLLVVTSCASAQGGQTTSIDWVDFIRFHGITYIRSSDQTLKNASLGAQVDTIQFKLEGNVQDPNYQMKDGDAAFLDSGTAVYAVKGYKSTFRLAVHGKNGPILYEVDTNPAAKKGADLLDIDGKVQSISVNSEQDGTTELGTIKDVQQVETLVRMILAAPVDQTQGPQGSKRYFLAFHLLDGTTVLRAYWLDSNELSRGIHLPKDFSVTIGRVVNKGL